MLGCYSDTQRSADFHMESTLCDILTRQAQSALHRQPRLLAASNKLKQECTSSRGSSVQGPYYYLFIQALASALQTKLPLLPKISTSDCLSKCFPTLSDTLTLHNRIIIIRYLSRTTGKKTKWPILKSKKTAASYNNPLKIWCHFTLMSPHLDIINIISC